MIAAPDLNPTQNIENGRKNVSDRPFRANAKLGSDTLVHVTYLRSSFLGRTKLSVNSQAYPMDPSISNLIRRFISTAYSIGSSFVNGSMKPMTIICVASASDNPRLIR